MTIMMTNRWKRRGGVFLVRDSTIIIIKVIAFIWDAGHWCVLTIVIDGCFMTTNFRFNVHLTATFQGDFVLCVKEGKRVSHYIINREEQGYRIGRLMFLYLKHGDRIDILSLGMAMRQNSRCASPRIGAYMRIFAHIHAYIYARIFTYICIIPHFPHPHDHP